MRARRTRSNPLNNWWRRLEEGRAPAVPAPSTTCAQLPQYVRNARRATYVAVFPITHHAVSNKRWTVNVCVRRGPGLGFVRCSLSYLL